MVKAVIFDLDGLLVDSEPVWFHVRTEMFQRFRIAWTTQDQKALMGKNTQAWIDYVYEKLGGKLSRDEVTNQTLDGMIRSYQTGHVRLMPGAQKAIEYCSSIATLGLASGSPKVLIDAALESNGWKGVFKEVLSSDEVPHGKPAPDVYLEVMKRLGMKPRECVVVEDSGSGILAGRASGAKVIAVPNKELMPPSEALANADKIIESLDDIALGIEAVSSR